MVDLSGCCTDKLCTSLLHLLQLWLCASAWVSASGSPVHLFCSICPSFPLSASLSLPPLFLFHLPAYAVFNWSCLAPLIRGRGIEAPSQQGVHQSPPSAVVVCQCLDLCKWFPCPFLCTVCPLFPLSASLSLPLHCSLAL